MLNSKLHSSRFEMRQNTHEKRPGKIFGLAALTALLLSSCGSGTDMVPFKLGQQPGQYNQNNGASSDDTKALTPKDLKLKMIQELMRYRASSYYLANVPTSTPATSGCVSYQYTATVPSRYLRATYDCTWQTTGASNATHFWTLTGTEDDSPPAAGDATKSVTSAATLTSVVRATAQGKALRQSQYTRNVKVSPIDASTFAVTATSSVANIATATPTPTPSSSDDLFDSYVPARPTPHPGHIGGGGSNNGQSLDKWSAKAEGHWVTQKDVGLTFANGGELTMTYNAPNGTVTTLTLDSTSTVTFDAKSSCPIPTGKFTWTSQVGSQTATTGSLTMDSTGINDDKSDGDKIAWPTTCLEFTPPTTPSPTPTPH